MIDHVQEAKNLLERSKQEDPEWAMLLVAQAQAHATVAMAEAMFNLERTVFEK